MSKVIITQFSFFNNTLNSLLSMFKLCQKMIILNFYLQPCICRQVTLCSKHSGWSLVHITFSKTIKWFLGQTCQFCNPTDDKKEIDKTTASCLYSSCYSFINSTTKNCYFAIIKKMCKKRFIHSDQRYCDLGSSLNYDLPYQFGSFSLRTMDSIFCLKPLLRRMAYLCPVSYAIY